MCTSPNRSVDMAGYARAQEVRENRRFYGGDETSVKALFSSLKKVDIYRTSSAVMREERSWEQS